MEEIRMLGPDHQTAVDFLKHKAFSGTVMEMLEDGRKSFAPEPAVDRFMLRERVAGGAFDRHMGSTKRGDYHAN
jgi:hypothetical protein